MKIDDYNNKISSLYLELTDVYKELARTESAIKKAKEEIKESREYLHGRGDEYSFGLSQGLAVSLLILDKYLNEKL